MFTEKKRLMILKDPELIHIMNINGLDYKFKADTSDLLFKIINRKAFFKLHCRASDGINALTILDFPSWNASLAYQNNALESLVKTINEFRIQNRKKRNNHV